MKGITKVAALTIIVLMITTCTITMAADTNDAATDSWSDDTYTDTQWYDKSETEFILQDAADLAGLAKLVNSSNTFEGKTVSLLANTVYDISAHEWTPIGTGTRDESGIIEDSNTFNGTFNGNGATISGLTITSNSSNKDDGVGFFGIVSGGTVENLNFTNVNISVSNSEMAGTVIGMMIDGATVKNCTVGSDSDEDTSSIIASRGNGGIVGRMTISGAIEGCTNYAHIKATGTGGNTGGIVGAAYYTETGKTMTVSDCHNHGIVESAGMGVGGIVGLSAANISKCTNDAEVSGTGTSIGGIVGEQKNYGTLTNCDNSGKVSNGSTVPGESDSNPGGMGTGGIIGWIRYSGNDTQYPLSSTITVTNCDNTGTIESQSTHVAGIVGAVYHSVEMTQCDNTGSITGQNFTGGLIGGMQTVDEYHPDDGCRLVMVNNTTSGNVSGGSQSGGAFGHYTADTTSTTENCVVPNGSNWTVYGNTINSTSSTGTITTDPIESVATVIIDGTTYGYPTVQDAVDNSSSGAEITMIADCTGSIDIPSGKTIILDLNGHKIDNTPNDHTISNAGTLTIEDSVGTGVVDNTSHACACIDNAVGGTVILNGGKFTRSLENGSSSIESGGNSYYNIVNHGKMTINDGVTVEQNGSYSSMVENGWQNGSQNTSGQESVMVINGGKFTGGLNTIKNDDYGNLTINDGTFENVAQSAVLNWNTAEINGGDFTSESSDTGLILNGYLDNTMDQGKLTITDGTFNGAVTVQKMGGSSNMGTISITGGTFNADTTVIDTANELNASITVSGGQFSKRIDTQYLADGFEELALNDQGMYMPSVSEENGVVGIGSAVFSSLEQAFEVAYGLDGDSPVTITLLDNLKSPGVLVQSGSNIILDFNEYTLTSTGGAGSAGTKTLAFQLLRDSTIVFKNGTLNGMGPDCKMLIQNYSDLTLDNMVLNSSLNADISYTVSNNNGSLNIDNGTVIYATEGNYAFDAYYWPSGGYPDGIAVKLVDGTINGDIQYSSDSEGLSDFIDKLVIEITGGTVNGSIEVASNIDEPNISISGGTFTEDVSDYLTDGFILQDNGDGTFGAIPGSETTISSPGDNGTVTTDGNSIIITSNGQDNATITIVFSDYDATMVLSGSFSAGSHTVIFSPVTGTEVLYDYAYEIETPSVTVSSITVTVPIDIPYGYAYTSAQVWRYDGDVVTLLPKPTFDATASELTFTTPGNSIYQIDVVFEAVQTGPDFPPIWDDDDDYVPPIVPSQTDDSSDDNTTTIVACAAAAVVAALMAAFLIIEHRRN